MDYTDIDYTSLVARLAALASSAFPDCDWTTIGPEVQLLQLNAKIGDVLAYYINNVGRESRWGTAQQRRSLLSLVKLIGYKPPGAVAARYTETFTLSAPASAPVTLLAGTVVQTSAVTSPVQCQLLAALVIATGQTTATATVENSAPDVDSFSSTGLADQQFVLSGTPYLDNSATVSAADGSYVEVSNFLASTPSSKHFTTSVDDLDRCTVTFGDGTNGSIPSGTITVTYKTGGGAAGNVVASALNRLPGNYTDANSNPVAISVTNAAATLAGVDRTSAAQIRVLAPGTLRVLGRAVAREDYEIGALAVPGVARALCLTSNEDPSIGENAGIVFLVPVGGGTASAGLCTSVLAQFKQQTGYGAPPYPGLNTFQIGVQTAAYLAINVTTQVYFRSGYAPATGAADIRRRLADWFAVTITPVRLWQIAPFVARSGGYSQTDALSVVRNPLVDFGYKLQDVDGEPIGSFGWAGLFELIDGTPGVLRVVATNGGLLLNGLQNDVAISTYQFPMLGMVGIVDANTGLAL